MIEIPRFCRFHGITVNELTFSQNFLIAQINLSWERFPEISSHNRTQSAETTVNTPESTC